MRHCLMTLVVISGRLKQLQLLFLIKIFDLLAVLLWAAWSLQRTENPEVVQALLCRTEPKTK